MGVVRSQSAVHVGDSFLRATPRTAPPPPYNPHTLNGDIVVNGIKTSTYTAAVEPSLAHSLLWPVRMLYSMGVNVVQGMFDQGSEAIVSLLPSGEKRYQ